MNITVYLGALEGNDPMLAEAVRELGMWIGLWRFKNWINGHACGKYSEFWRECDRS